MITLCDTGRSRYGRRVRLSRPRRPALTSPMFFGQRKSRYDAGPDFLGDFASPAAEIDQLYQLRLSHLRPVDQPLVLISQIQRSGGSLMSQLFDGHPDCHTHPHELKIGNPSDWIWPDLDLTKTPEVWFENLFERSHVKLFQDGYNKYVRKVQKDPETFPFLFLPNLQRHCFLRWLADHPPRTQRDVLNAYMTSYFHAWLDYQGVYDRRKWVVGFVPRVAMDQGSVDRLFRDYPDGRLISTIREPVSWYASAHKQQEKRYPNVPEAMKLWKQSVEALLHNRARYGDRTLVLTFEALVSDTETVMRRICRFLDVAFDPVMLTPTFQHMPIKANTSFENQSYGVLPDAANRRGEVPADEVAAIEAETSEVYAQAREMIAAQG